MAQTPVPLPPFPPTTPPPWTPPPRGLRDPTELLSQKDRNTRWFTDLYAFLLRIGWMRLLLMYTGLYLSANAVFATLYVALGAQIKGARPGHWGDAFFFSVQTISTIGYGGMTPEGVLANLLVTVESMIGLIAVALATGLVFAKFARPTARVLFSRTALRNYHNGKPALVFRLANQRSTNIVEATLRVTALLNETTKEGQKMRRLHDIDILRDFTPIFLLSWLIIHVIDEKSPLYGMTEQEMAEKDLRLFVTMTGIDGIFSQTIHAYHVYWAEDILWNMDFVDVIERLPNHLVHLHFEKFHDIIPQQIPSASEAQPDTAPQKE